MVKMVTPAAVIFKVPNREGHAKRLDHVKNFLGLWHQEWHNNLPCGLPHLLAQVTATREILLHVAMPFEVKLWINAKRLFLVQLINDT
jgi:hypothetical protein